MTAQHVTPFGEVPGSVVINFALIDAAAHAWDVSASVGRAIEFPPDWIPGMTGVVGLTCNEHTVEIGLVKPPTEPPPDATDTQRLMAAAGQDDPRLTRLVVPDRAGARDLFPEFARCVCRADA